jgi:hypothetical protein
MLVHNLQDVNLDPISERWLIMVDDVFRIEEHGRTTDMRHLRLRDVDDLFSGDQVQMGAPCNHDKVSELNFG